MMRTASSDTDDDDDDLEREEGVVAVTVPAADGDHGDSTAGAGTTADEGADGGAPSGSSGEAGSHTSAAQKFMQMVEEKVGTLRWFSKRFSARKKYVNLMAMPAPEDDGEQGGGSGNSDSDSDKQGGDDRRRRSRTGTDNSSSKRSSVRVLSMDKDRQQELATAAASAARKRLVHWLVVCHFLLHLFAVCCPFRSLHRVPPLCPWLVCRAGECSICRHSQPSSSSR